MAKTDIKIALLEQSMKQNEQDHAEIKVALGEIKTSIADLDTRFSAKWVEKGIIVIISAIVLGAIYEVFRRAGVPIQ